MNTTEAIKQLLKIVEELRVTYKDKNKMFTLDGRLVGDIGEVIVEDYYDIQLFNKVVPRYDGEDSLGRKVQIKATFQNTLGFPCKFEDIPDYYIGIKILSNGTFQEIFNGPGYYIWEIIKDRKMTKNSLHTISISLLQKVNLAVLDDNRIKIRNVTD